MMADRDPFDSLDLDCGGSARRLAAALHAALDEVGLTPDAIRKVGCALLSVGQPRSTDESRDGLPRPETDGDPGQGRLRKIPHGPATAPPRQPTDESSVGWAMVDQERQPRHRGT